MFDLKWIRDSPEAFDRGLGRRGLAPASASVLALDRKWREAQTGAEQLQAGRNRLSKEIGAAKAQGRDAGDIMRRVARSNEQQAELEARAGLLKSESAALLATLPNPPAADVPDGLDEKHNKLVRQHGTPPRFDFAPRDHVAIGEGRGIRDFPRAGKLSGARFGVLYGQLAQLERALAQFMLDLHTREFGYREASPPLLVRDETMFGTAQLPKFAEDQFKTTTGLWLIPTPEVTLTNLAADEILDGCALPPVGREGRALRPYSQRLGSRRGPDPRRHAGELPAGRRQRRRAGRAQTLYGRARGDRRRWLRRASIPHPRASWFPTMTASMPPVSSSSPRSPARSAARSGWWRRSASRAAPAIRSPSTGRCACAASARAATSSTPRRPTARCLPPTSSCAPTPPP